MEYDKRIEVDGNDGTGKTTLVQSLREMGYKNVHDRGDMAKATDHPKVQPNPDTTYILLVCPPEVSKSRLISRGADMDDPYHTDKALAYYDSRFRMLAKRFNAHVIQSVYKKDTLNKALEAIRLG